VELGHVAILRGSEKIAPTVRISNERKNVSNGDLKRIFARRSKALIVVLAVGVGGVAWSGCGSDDDDTSSQIEQNINEGVDEAQDAVEEGVDEAQESFDENTDGETKKDLEDARDDVEEGFEEGKDKAEKGIEEGKSEAEEGIDEAQK